jgi:hypothetical protein
MIQNKNSMNSGNSEPRKKLLRKQSRQRAMARNQPNARSGYSRQAVRAKREVAKICNADGRHRRIPSSMQPRTDPIGRETSCLSYLGDKNQGAASIVRENCTMQFPKTLAWRECQSPRKSSRQFMRPVAVHTSA